MVIYEVNLAIEPDVLDEYLSWLQEHIQAILKLDGFTTADTYTLEGDDEKHHLRVQYYLKDRESLQAYFYKHATAFRNDGLQRFEGKFSASRNVLTARPLITI
ncbi:DUF4286 family protein [Endozoicomonadaceae bacterium StTr2]